MKRIVLDSIFLRFVCVRVVSKGMGWQIKKNLGTNFELDGNMIFWMTGSFLSMKFSKKKNLTDWWVLQMFNHKLKTKMNKITKLHSFGLFPFSKLDESCTKLSKKWNIVYLCATSIQRISSPSKRWTGLEETLLLVVVFLD